MLTIEIARTWYPAADAVHGFDHVLRVYRMAEHLAQAEGADMEIVRAAALLHDASPGNGSVSSDDVDEEQVAALQQERAVHHYGAAEFAAQMLSAEGWPETRIAAVQHCIRAHRFRDTSEPPRTLEAQVLFDADKLDAIGAIGVARVIGYAVQAKQPAYARPSECFCQTGQLEPGEPHSAYHEYIFKLVKLKGRLFTATARTLAEERHRLMETFFAQLETEAGGEMMPPQ